MKIQLPEAVSQIIERLSENGYEGYAVGGCIRDALLCREPDDWDITTSAAPWQVKKLFPRTVDTGLVHGTVTVLIDKEGYEVTTYRIDGEYEDSRHPREVSFTSSLTEDLKRRDFTINAMAYNEKKGLVDEFSGARDLKSGIIRCVGEPMERFSEDALRILRAVRFSAQLGFYIEGNTRTAAAALALTLKNISAERIAAELVKLIVSPHPEVLKAACEMGITAVILPEFDEMMKTGQMNPHHCFNVGDHTLRAMLAVKADKVLRLTMLCHDFGKPCTRTTDESGRDHFIGHAKISSKMARNLLKRLKFDNDTLYQVEKLVLHHDYRIPQDEKGVRRAIFKVGEGLFEKLLMVQEADILAQSSYKQPEKLEQLEAVRNLYQQILKKKQCLSLKDLAVSGRDLIMSGIKPGKEIGEILDQMLQNVLEYPEHNDKNYLIEHFVRKGKNEHVTSHF